MYKVSFRNRVIWVMFEEKAATGGDRKQMYKNSRYVQRSLVTG